MLDINDAAQFFHEITLYNKHLERTFRNLERLINHDLF